MGLRIAHCHEQRQQDEHTMADHLKSLFQTVAHQAKDDTTAMFILLAAAVGVVSLSRYAVSLGKVVLDLARSGKSLSKYGARQGAWAIVTGCTSGIGREFALQLSKAGFKVLLVSRNEKALLALQSELKNESRIHAIDFGTADNAAYASLAETVSSLGGKVGVLVNNVGVGHSMPVPFELCSEEEMEGVININVRATMKVTQMVLPSMLESHKGLIMNIGSFAALTSSPLLAPYAGTKSFLQTWSQALSSELQGKGVDCWLVNTYFVVSNLSKIRKSNFFTPYPSTYVRSVLSHIGLQCGAIAHPYVTTPFWTHALAQWAVDHLWTKAGWMWYTKRMHIDIRKRALRKQKRLQEQQAKQE